MSANVEIKARMKNPDALHASLKRLTEEPPVRLQQEDVFFAVPKGRLKMRSDEDGHCELIYYRRKDEKGPVLSRYFRQQVLAPEETRRELEQRYGVKNVVKKLRELYRLRNARIHLDFVEDLGDFVEIEIVLDSPQGANRGKHAAKHLMRLLQIDTEDLVESAYDDLLNPKHAKRRKRVSHPSNK